MKPRQKPSLLWVGLLPVAFLYLLLQGLLAQEPPKSATARPAHTDEQRIALQALGSELERFAALLEDDPDASHRASVKKTLDALTERSVRMHQAAFDPIRYDELRLELVIEHQRLALWLNPKTPPLAPNVKTAAPRRAVAESGLSSVNQAGSGAAHRVANAETIHRAAGSSEKFPIHAIGSGPAVMTLAEAKPYTFTDQFCANCHDSDGKKGGLDVTAFDTSLNDPAKFATWVKIFDRVQRGEMPPKEKKRPDAEATTAFLKSLGASLVNFEREAIARQGRTARRRLNRSEYENSLRDLLQAPWLQVKEQLPEDGEAFHFNKVSQALDVSFVHMARYMAAAEYALKQAMSVEYVRPPTRTLRNHARDNESMTNFVPHVFNNSAERLKFPIIGTQVQADVRARLAPLTVGDANPELRDQEAVGWTCSNYVTGFDSEWNNYRAPVTGRYRLRFSGYSLWVGGGGHNTRFSNAQDKIGKIAEPSWYMPNSDYLSPGRRNEPITIYAKGRGPNRRLGEFDLTPEPTVTDLGEVILLAGDVIVTDAVRLFRSRPLGSRAGWTNPLAQKDGQPGVAFRWMEIEGPLYDGSSSAGYRLLFGDLPLRKATQDAGALSIDAISPDPSDAKMRGRNRSVAQAKVEVVSKNPRQDAERLLRVFLQRAYRRPATDDDTGLFLQMITQQLDRGMGFAEAMLAGYTAVLASPQFVFIDERPGRLDDFALASRLAFFLWNSGPDEILRIRAARGELHRPDTLRAETERMLADPKSARFIEAFLDYWLELRKIEENTPSATLYNDYYLDEALTEAALDETRLYFGELVRRDLPARQIVDSDFTYLNERLATHYDIPGVEGAAMRRVALPRDSVRGGLMTQASVLKVTANGTTTSPVTRGKWVMERIMGFDLPPPPTGVPAVEPDIRGAVTVRQQLDKHRADESCAVCHRKIDPPGFALESFDVMGGWRDRYRATGIGGTPEKGFGKNGWPFLFYFALPVDATGELADGRAFKDVRDFKKLLLTDETQIARNFLRQLSVFATGAPVRFSDRPQIEEILQATTSSRYGVRGLIHELVQSELFQTK